MTLTEGLFPPHKAELSLTHNEHRSCYETIQEWEVLRQLTADDWVSPEQRQLAIDNDSLWILQWYPDTPVGFRILAAGELSALLEAATT